MDDLIKALNIFRKYSNTEYPTCCEHDVLMVDVDWDDVSDEDKATLKELSFVKDSENKKFLSYRFGSC